jgi:MYXO-CTERM domain-containing protein
MIVPGDGEHPSNAAVLIFGGALRPDALTATIDGIAAEIYIDTALARPDGHFANAWQLMPLRLDPQPTPGQTVAFTGNACGEFECGGGELEITYVATEPDEAIAKITPTVTFDLARLTNNGWTSCGAWGSFVRTMVDFDAAALADEELIIYEVVARNDDAELEGTDRYRSTWLEWGSFVLFEPGIVGETFPLDGWCVEVKLMDAAGNVAAHVTTCEPSGCYEGEPTPAPSDTPFEPWPCESEGGTSTGGETDDTSAATTSPDEGSTGVVDPTNPADTTAAPADTQDHGPSLDDGGVTGRGCSCVAAPRDAAPAWLLSFLAALALSRRRR